MAITFRITAFHEETATLAVRYLSPEVPDGIPFSIAVPEQDGFFPSGEDLLALIASHAPLDLFAAAVRGNYPPPGIDMGSPEPPFLFDEGTVFVTPEQQVMFLPRPLVRIRQLPLPIDVL